MTLFAKRSYISATWRRPTVVPDAATNYQNLGTLQIQVPVVTTEAQSEDFVSAPTGRFDINFDPDQDLQQGDLLTWGGIVHEVSEVRNFAQGKRRDHAEASVFRKEVGTDTEA